MQTTSCGYSTVTWAISSQSPYASLGGVYEEYRYDALGRRIWRRSEHSAGGTPAWFVERTVWDGDEYLYEARSSDPNPYADLTLEVDATVVGYVNGAGLDSPLGVSRGPGLLP